MSTPMSLAIRIVPFCITLCFSLQASTITFDFGALNATSAPLAAQDAFAGDFGGWASVGNCSAGNDTHRVQNAFRCPGYSADLGVETRVLDVVGYDLAAPEPGPLSLVGIGLAAFAASRLRRSPV